MKKTLTMLSILTTTSTVVPTTVACVKKELVLSSLNKDSFKQLDTIKGLTLGGSLETKDISKIEDDQKLIIAIEDHIKVMTLKKIFCLSSLIPKSDNEAKTFTAFIHFWQSANPPILNVRVEIVETKKRYKIVVKKEKWENVKITSKDNVVDKNTIKPYYDLIKGEEVEIVIEL